MAAVILTLGGVAFRDFEIPERIVFGGMQRLAVHHPVGGGRVVDVLGSSAREIEFSGVFSGPDAEARAQMLDAACSAGLAVPLIWGGFANSVMLESFSAAYRKPWWIPFHVSMVPVLLSTPVGILPLVQAALDIASAGTFSVLSGVSFAMINSVSVAGVVAAQTTLGVTIEGAGRALDAAGALFAGSAGAAQAVSALGTLGGATATLAGASAASVYLRRAAGNFALGPS